ncbi:MAG: UbiA family prenyltransferase [Planctomycetes bacterium]|nr:UbiA family prenyltransferase [Planctomycetota bacterium]
MSRVLDYARLLRVPNAFTAMADICLGALATGALPERWLQFALLLLSSVALYCSGIVWNDYFDLAQDQRERPFRPLASGRVTLGAAIRLGALLMAAGVILAGLADLGADGFRWRSLPLAMVLVGTIFLYDGWFKKTYIGPAAMGACRFLNLLLGLSVASGGTGAWGIALGLVVGLYIAGVTLFARTEASISKPVVLLIGAGLMLSGLLLALTVPNLAQYGGFRVHSAILFPYLLAAFGFYIAVPVVRAIQNPLPRNVQAVVKRAVLGLVLLDAVLATSLAGLIGLLLVVLLVPAYVLSRWIYVT